MEKLKSRWGIIPNKKWRLIACLLVSAMLLLTYSVYLGVNQTRNRTAADRFNTEVTGQVDQLRDRFESYADTLYSCRALFLTVDHVSSQDWSVFVSAQNINRRYPGVLAIGYVELTDNQRALLTYIAPAGINQSGIGYDFYTSPARKMMLDTARDSGVPSASEPIRFKIVPPKNSASLLIAMPVYKKGKTVYTVAERRAAIQGFTVMALQSDKLLDSIFKAPAAYGDSAVNITTAGQRIYSANNENSGPLDKTVSADLGGQSWRLDFSAPASYGLSRTGKFGPAAIMVGGLILTCVATLAFFRFIKKQHPRSS